MAQYNVLDVSKVIDEKFRFLISEYGYALTERRQENYGYYTVYERSQRKVYLGYDYRENFFYFILIRGKYTVYPNDHDQENIKPFFRLFEKYEADLEKKIQPDDSQYLEALELNASLLKKYGDKVLKGEEWI